METWWKSGGSLVEVNADCDRNVDGAPMRYCDSAVLRRLAPIPIQFGNQIEQAPSELDCEL